MASHRPNLCSRYDGHFVGITRCNFVELRGDDLVCYSNIQIKLNQLVQGNVHDMITNLSKKRFSEFYP